MYVIALALEDGAFKSPRIQSAQDLYRWTIALNSDSLYFRFKKDTLETPVFRKSNTKPAGVETSRTDPVTTRMIIDQCHDLGKGAGVINTLKPYCFRRGAGEAMDNTLKEEEVAPSVQSAFIG
ncbi:hypothetical protein TWF694_005648 [Orbilia ellipsospora]|uniref:Uncharacterized protein n=1 Tax=Orbilia ellipsospora TaxID=2528407 RepID=A0AAV9WTP4_9PEZI